MATQLKHSDFTTSTALTPRPNIRVAFLAGEAATAVYDAAARLPEETREATLDELAIGEMTEALLARAEQQLSARVYAAFLEWGSAAAVATGDDSDEDGRERGDDFDRAWAALQALAATPAAGFQDFLLKTWVMSIEVADGHPFGPLPRKDAGAGTFIEELMGGVAADLTLWSPVVADVERLAAAAAKSGRAREGYHFTAAVGAIIAKGFAKARTSDRDRVAAVGPASAWQAARATHEAALAADTLINAEHSRAHSEGRLTDELETEWDASGTRLSNSEWDLFWTAAPDAEALLWKLTWLSKRELAFEDEIADLLIADVTRLTATAAADPHVGWLEERNQIMATMNSTAGVPMSDEMCSDMIDRSNSLDCRIAEASAAGSNAVIAKLALIAQLALEGFEPNLDWCASALVDARRVAGIGSLGAAVEARHQELGA